MKERKKDHLCLCLLSTLAVSVGKDILYLLFLSPTCGKLAMYLVAEQQGLVPVLCLSRLELSKVVRVGV